MTDETDGTPATLDEAIRRASLALQSVDDDGTAGREGAEGDYYLEGARRALDAVGLPELLAARADPGETVTRAAEAFAAGTLTPPQVRYLATAMDLPHVLVRAAYRRVTSRPKTIVRRLSCGHDATIPNGLLATGHEQHQCPECGGWYPEADALPAWPSTYRLELQGDGIYRLWRDGTPVGCLVSGGGHDAWTGRLFRERRGWAWVAPTRWQALTAMLEHLDASVEDLDVSDVLDAADNAAADAREELAMAQARVAELEHRIGVLADAHDQLATALAELGRDGRRDGWRDVCCAGTASHGGAHRRVTAGGETVRWDHAHETVTAAHWRQSVDEIRRSYPVEVFSDHGDSPEAAGGRFARSLCDMIARRAGEIAGDGHTGGTPGA